MCPCVEIFQYIFYSEVCQKLEDIDNVVIDEINGSSIHVLAQMSFCITTSVLFRKVGNILYDLFNI